MTHMDEGRLQAYADDALDGDDRVVVERHLRDCLACRSELGEIRSMAADFTAAMRALDRTEPAVAEYAVGFPRKRTRSLRAVSVLPRAAVLLLGFAAAASAMVPGSPLYRWIRPEGEEVRVAAAPAERAVAPTAAAAESAAPEAGVSIEPVDGVVRVVLRGASPGVQIRALLSDGGRAGVFATGAAAGARFETAPGRIEVEGATGGVLRVELPRAARTATVVVNGREYLRKQGDQLVMPSDDRSGAEISFHP